MFGNQSIAMAGTAPPSIVRGILPQHPVRRLFEFLSTRRMHSWCWIPTLLHCPSFHHHSIHLKVPLWKAALAIGGGTASAMAIVVATTLNYKCDHQPKLCFPSSFTLSALEKKNGWCSREKDGWCPDKIWTCMFHTMSHYKPKTCIRCVQSVSGQN